MQILTQAMGRSVAEAFKKLLSEKHLYQYVEVDLKPVSDALEVVRRDWEAAAACSAPKLGSVSPEEKLSMEMKRATDGIWFPREATHSSFTIATDAVYVPFELPTINTFCGFCGNKWPFNAVADGTYFIQGKGQDEFFYLGYQCQQCKELPIRLLVRREGLRIRLAGRYPLEILPTPKSLPKNVCKYYSNAFVAHHAGQTLAGLFLLRVFIEQFWRTIPKVQELISKHQKATGDEQGSAYQETLPQDFKSRFPSLLEIYDKLSAAMHTADGNAALFDESCSKIVKHFEARILFEL